MPTPKLIAANGPYEVYRAGHVLIVQRDGEFYCNLRKADRGFASPAEWVAELIAVEADRAAEAAAADAERRARVAAALAARAERRSAQLGFAL